MEKALDLEKFAMFPGQRIPDGQKPCPDGTVRVLYILTCVKKITCYQIKYRKIISKCHCETFKVIIELLFFLVGKKKKGVERDIERENGKKKGRDGRSTEEMRVTGEKTLEQNLS